MAWGRRKSTTLTPREAQRVWQRALRAAVSEDWAAAETWLERIVESDSTNLDAYHALARLYRQQGAIGRAIRMHQNLLLRPDLAGNDRGEALLELARDFEAGGFSERAAASYEEFLAEQPRHAEAIERLIPLHAEQRQFTRALALCKKLRRADSDKAHRLEVELLLVQARCALEEGDHAGARSAVKRCLRSDKNCAEAYSLLGELETERGKSAKALDAWKRAAAADPTLAKELYSKIDAGFAARGKPAEFDAFLREVLTSRPEEPFARIALARALASRGEGHAAIEELARAIDITPDVLPLRAELGRQLLAANLESEALKAYSDLVEAIERKESDVSGASSGDIASRDSSQGEILA
jgi:lipopolysaccharide biosynthesis regulator YciM